MIQMESHFIEKHKHTSNLVVYFFYILYLKSELSKCLNSVFKVIFSDLIFVTLLQTFESAVQENVSINGQAWQEASDDCFMGMWLPFVPLSFISELFL